MSWWEPGWEGWDWKEGRCLWVLQQLNCTCGVGAVHQFFADPCSGSPPLVSTEVTAEHLPSSLPWSMGCTQCFPVILEAPGWLGAFP